VTPEELSAHLDEHRSVLMGFVRRHAGLCLRHESADDLVQGIHLQAISRAEKFEYRSRPEFEAWVLRIARGHLSDRRDYWTAAKRRPERLLRLTRPDSDSPAPGSAREPALRTPGPVTRADRADRLRLAEEALTMLLPRDAELVRGQADGLTIEDEAERLEISYAAAQRARLRALERYRKAFLLLARGR
jgi:RNA polymerase sigma factor (sigma-70 family)